MTERADHQRDYPRSANWVDVGLVGRYEIIVMAGLDPASNSAQTWWRASLRERRFPPADGQDIDGKPTWRRRTMLWWMQTKRHRQQANRPMLSPADDAEATALQEAHPAAYRAFVVQEEKDDQDRVRFNARYARARVPAGSRERTGRR